MESQGFRYREKEAAQPPTPSTPHPVSQERQRPEARERQAPGSESCGPTPSGGRAVLQDSAELGSLAVLFQIAESRPRPDPGSALEILRQRVRERVESVQVEESVSSRTALRDRLTTTDSLWVPSLKWVMVVLICALLAAVVYGVVRLLEPSGLEPAAVTGAAWMILSGL